MGVFIKQNYIGLILKPFRGAKLSITVFSELIWTALLALRTGEEDTWLVGVGQPMNAVLFTWV